MKTLTRLSLVLLVTSLVASRPAFAQLITDFEGFAEGTEVAFQEPGFSGSTSGNIDTATDFSATTNTFPAGNAGAGSSTYNINFTFNSAVAGNWVRVTTFNAANVPNPTVDFAQSVQLDIYSDNDVYLTLGIRETGTSAAIGADGGSAGGIEWVGGITDDTTSPPLGRLISGGSWVTLKFDLPLEPVKAFAGATADGTLSSATGLGTIEHLAFMPVDSGVLSYDIFIDNLQVVPVPEPGTYALLGLGLAGLALSRRWRSR